MVDDQSHAAGVALLQVSDKRAQLSIDGRNLQYHIADWRQAFKHWAHHASEELELAARVGLGMYFPHAFALERWDRLLCAPERGLGPSSPCRPSRGSDLLPQAALTLYTDDTEGKTL